MDVRRLINAPSEASDPFFGTISPVIALVLRARSVAG